MGETKNTLVFSPGMGDPEDGEPLNREYVTQVLAAIFSPGPVRELLQESLTLDGTSFATFNGLIDQLRGFFFDNMSGIFQQSGFGNIDTDFIIQAQRLGDFERRYRADSRRFNATDIRDRQVLYWPDPSHSTHPSTLFEQLPYVAPLDLVDKSTPIGSAGSCFASEIAWYLQDNGYNYVVEEFDTRDAPKPESPARWGIIFNTPSFRQLAEKAFGLREMPNLAEYHSPNKSWQDPFRENVVFGSIEELEADRAGHLEACRRAFMKCRLFVITLGLNECWEFIPDGTVASRNPKTGLHFALFRHRVLSVAENVANLQRFVDVLRQHNQDIQLVVTVSPVPFLATGLAAEKHVIVANAHSKAVLRVAAEEFVAANDGVYYFPSFEMVSHCIENPWQADQRHISRDAVARIMELFEVMFVRGERET